MGRDTCHFNTAGWGAFNSSAVGSREACARLTRVSAERPSGTHLDSGRREYEARIASLVPGWTQPRLFDSGAPWVSCRGARGLRRMTADTVLTGGSFRSAKSTRERIMSPFRRTCDQA